MAFLPLAHILIYETSCALYNGRARYPLLLC